MICANKALPSMFRGTIIAFTGAAICLAGISPPAAAEPSTANREADADRVLDAIFWSKITPPTAAQEASRKALPLEVKEALVAVAQNEPLDLDETAALSMAGLAELNPANTTWKLSEAETVAVPVGKSIAASSALNRAAAQCWITRAEVQKWGFATQSFGWCKRQL